MDITELLEKGGIVPQTTVEKTINWVHLDDEGKEHQFSGTVRVRKLSGGALETLWKRFSKGSEDQSFAAQIVSTAVEFEGKRLTYDQAYWLERSCLEALCNAVDEVNPFKSESVDKTKN